MAEITLTDDALRDLLKTAVADALTERRDWLREIVADVMEDIALARAIEEGESSGLATREEVAAALSRKP